MHTRQDRQDKHTHRPDRYTDKTNTQTYKTGRTHRQDKHTDRQTHKQDSNFTGHKQDKTNRQTDKTDTQTRQTHRQDRTDTTKTDSLFPSSYYLPRTSRVTICLCKPALLLATHSYVPWNSGRTSLIVRTEPFVFNRSLVSFRRSWSLYHTTAGTGSPSVRHSKRTDSPSRTVWLRGTMSNMRAGTET